MTGTGRAYRAWIMEQVAGGVTPVQESEDRIRFVLPTATAEINFYPFDEDEIVELRVVRTSDGDSTFFLHFALGEDLDHARELFGQLADALAEEGELELTHVLLTCTSALTTTMFAAKMNQVAETFKLGYDFTALPVDRALQVGGQYAAVMLAPQAAYMKQQMTEAHPHALVFEVPGKIFGAYDAPGAIRLLMHAFRELETPGDEDRRLKAVRDLSDDRRVLVITLFSLNGEARLGYRLYDHGEMQTEGAVRKPRIDYNDVGDLIEMLAVGEVDLASLDAIAVAVPGVTYRGMVSLPTMGIDFFDLGMALTERFGVPTYVDNNCNAAAVGCYVSQDDVESLVFYRHAFGHPAGGMGTVIDGRVLKGRLNLAGEPHYVDSLFSLGAPMEEAVWTEEGLHRIALCVCASVVAFTSPDALYVAVDTVDDASEFAAELAELFGETYVPAIHVVGDYVERVYLGTLAMALQKLRDPKYRSLGVGNPGSAFDREKWQQARERVHPE